MSNKKCARPWHWKQQENIWEKLNTTYVKIYTMFLDKMHHGWDIHPPNILIYILVKIS